MTDVYSGPFGGWGIPGGWEMYCSGSGISGARGYTVPDE